MVVLPEAHGALQLGERSARAMTGSLSAKDEVEIAEMLVLQL